MRLTDEEQAMLAGALGEPRRWAIEHQIAVGEFFDNADLVPVSQAHIMADTESLGDAALRFLESLAAPHAFSEAPPSPGPAARPRPPPRSATPRENRPRAARRFRLEAQPRDLSEWGALGGIVGHECGSYWEVPLIEGIDTPPGSDALKHLGTAMASYGSTALFHLPGITAESSDLDRPRPAGIPATGSKSWGRRAPNPS